MNVSLPSAQLLFELKGSAFSPFGQLLAMEPASFGNPAVADELLTVQPPATRVNVPREDLELDHDIDMMIADEQEQNMLQWVPASI